MQNHQHNSTAQKNLDPEIVKILNVQIAKIASIAKTHGGGVSIVEASEERVTLHLEGHCAGCALSPITYGMVLNKNIKEALPKIKQIKYTY